MVPQQSPEAPAGATGPAAPKPSVPPVSTTPGSGYNTGPHFDPIKYPVPEHAKHEEGWVQYNVGDPVEFDGGESTVVNAVHVAGPPFGRPRKLPLNYASLAEWEDDQRAANPHWPFRELKRGDVQVRGGAPGTVSSIGSDTVTVMVAPHDTQIREGALTKRELAAIERHKEASGHWAFGFEKQHAVPLKLEEERVWADTDPNEAGAPMEATA